MPAAFETDPSIVIGRHGRRRLVIHVFLSGAERRRGWRPFGRHDGESTPTVNLNGRWYKLAHPLMQNYFLQSEEH